MHCATGTFAGDELCLSGYHLFHQLQRPQFLDQPRMVGTAGGLRQEAFQL